ncbi:DUF3106 domain-containing protein [Luteimonas sp. RIT-PG2_3]
MTRTPTRVLLPLLLVLAGSAGQALAGDPPRDASRETSREAPREPLPDWNDLSRAHREQLSAPIRDRWNNSSQDERAGMLRHASRWQRMSPEDRERASQGVNRWQDLAPDKRYEMRALYHKLDALSETERDAFRRRWRAMTLEQRREWVQANPPPRHDGHDGKR